MEESPIFLRSLKIPSSNLPGNTYRRNHQGTNIASRQSFQQSPISSTSDTSGSRKTIQPLQQDLLSRLSQWTSKWITDWWGLELICWAVAAISLAAIVIILESHKNKPLPEWSFGITLNSLISVFATIGQMAMMQPVAECINQLKWLWFIRREKLVRFQAFENASKGLIGSLFLMARLRTLDLVSLGAAITIASVAFGPFAQQIVTYPLRLHQIGTATTPQVFNYTGGGDEGQYPTSEIIASVSEGLTFANLNLSSVAPSCSTGNCTWTAYSSLAVCGTVSDISSSLRNNSCNITSFDEIFDVAGVENPGYPCFNYTLPEMAFLPTSASVFNPISNATLSNGANDLYQESPLMKVMGVYPAALSYSSAIITAYLMFQPDLESSINSSLSDPIIYELNLNLCVQKYNTIVSKGVVNTTLLSSQILTEDLKEDFNVSSDTTTFIGNDTFVSIGDNVFGASWEALAIFQSGLSPIFSAEAFIFTTTFNGGSFSNVSTEFSDFFAPSFFNAVTSTDPLSNVTWLWDNIATSITNTFRQEAGGDTVVGSFPGFALEPVAFVETEYLWLILPMGLVCFTLIFLLATIRRSQQLGSRVWKSSNLAVLQGLQTDLHSHLGGLSSISEMEEKAKDVEVRIDMKGGKAEKGVEYRLVESKQEEYWRG